MTIEELKKRIKEIIDSNIWFDGGDALHYDYEYIVEDFLELFHEYRNS